MKTLLFSLFILWAQVLSSQTFTEVMGTPFEPVYRSSIAFADVDGDNDQDVLITGQNNSNQPISKLYTNDGAGTFTEISGTPFNGVWEGSIAFADVDGDGDQDVFITGISGLSGISKLYTNDGAGTFTEMTGAPFEPVYRSSIAFADVDGDNDQDVLITGQNNSNQPISKLYTNDGAGTFTEMTDTPFNGVFDSSIAFADVDGDGDQDVLITGRKNSSWNGITKLYTNDGLGTFTEVAGTPFYGVWSSSIAFEDVDGDNDQDVLITGQNNSLDPFTKLYTNDGLGDFTEVADTPLEDVSDGSVAFADVDGDNDQDVLITGHNGSSTPGITKLYTNDGLGNFTEVANTPFQGIWHSISPIAFADVDGDGDQDVLITGLNNSDDLIAKLYINDKLLSTDNINSELPFDFILYPNPVPSNILTLIWESIDYGSVTLSIYDLQGRKLVQQQRGTELGTNIISIDITFLAKGDYILQLADGKRRGSQKIMIP